MAGLCLEQAQPFHPYELSGPVHLYGCLLTMGKCSFALFLECHISQIHVKLFLWWPCITPIIFLMRLCLNVPWHLKCAILSVAHPYMYAREMQKDWPIFNVLKFVEICRKKLLFPLLCCHFVQVVPDLRCEINEYCNLLIHVIGPLMRNICSQNTYKKCLYLPKWTVGSGWEELWNRRSLLIFVLKEGFVILFN